MAKAPKKEKEKGLFDDCTSFDEGKELYRKTLFKVHPDQNPDDPDAATKVVKLKKAFDLWVTKKAWEAHQQGGNFRGAGGLGGRGYGGSGYQPRSTDPEDYLSVRTKEKLREVIESGLNCSVELVGSFIWLDEVSPGDILTLIAWDFTYSKKYNKWFWADFDYMKQQGTLPKGRFHGTYEDMKRIHLNKGVKEKVFLADRTQEEEDEDIRNSFGTPASQ